MVNKRLWLLAREPRSCAESRPITHVAGQTVTRWLRRLEALGEPGLVDWSTAPHLFGGDTLVVIKPDRLGRSVHNLKKVAEDLQARGIGLKTLSQGIDTTTPGGRLPFHMLAAIAEFEHDLIVERTQDGLAAARARGGKGRGRFKMTATKARPARAMYDEKTYTR